VANDNKSEHQFERVFAIYPNSRPTESARIRADWSAIRRLNVGRRFGEIWCRCAFRGYAGGKRLGRGNALNGTVWEQSHARRNEYNENEIHYGGQACKPDSVNRH
jgi:hypothetical protein